MSTSFPPDPKQVAAVAEILGAASRVLFITGAGLSADSGLPTYRGVGGLYEDADTPEGIPIEVALSGQMLLTRPEVSWKHIREIERACRGASANAGHRAIAALEEGREAVWVLTQNVDGLHRAAGSTEVIDIHGDVHSLSCMACDWGRVVQDYTEMEGSGVPRCPECGAVVRPDVVLFGEALPLDRLGRLEAVFRRGFEVVVSIGTTSVFPYIAGPVQIARELGIPSVEINPGVTEVSHLVTHRMQSGAAATLEALVGACT